MQFGAARYREPVLSGISAGISTAGLRDVDDNAVPEFMEQPGAAFCCHADRAGAAIYPSTPNDWKRYTHTRIQHREFQVGRSHLVVEASRPSVTD